MLEPPAHWQVRIARPVHDLSRTQQQYCAGLGLRLLDRFEDHDGFDGIMLGREHACYHFEFTRNRLHPVVPTPTVEDLVVFYLADRNAYAAACQRMQAAGFRPVPAFNPYWDNHGLTFVDGDGYRIVLHCGPAPKEA